MDGAILGAIDGSADTLGILDGASESDMQKKDGTGVGAPLLPFPIFPDFELPLPFFPDLELPFPLFPELEPFFFFFLLIIVILPPVRFFGPDGLGFDLFDGLCFGLRSFCPGNRRLRF
mmetsp:Transcript_14962/g.30508  ORF Transcript_14962/g.30508 Transcript_14962/m.30508 type:complete len:118 (+) Transcript_14962:2-355(+)